MKAVGLFLFILLLVPIYVLPWVSIVASGFFWGAEATCYVLLLVTSLIFAKGARWTAALIAFAAAFDLLPILDFIPFVPTVMFIIAFVFMAKAQPAQAGTAGAPA